MSWNPLRSIMRKRIRLNLSWVWMILTSSQSMWIKKDWKKRGRSYSRINLSPRRGRSQSMKKTKSKRFRLEMKGKLNHRIKGRKRVQSKNYLTFGMTKILFSSQKTFKSLGSLKRKRQLKLSQWLFLTQGRVITQVLRITKSFWTKLLK